MVLSNLTLLCKPILKTWMLPTYFLPCFGPNQVLQRRLFPFQVGQLRNATRLFLVQARIEVHGERRAICTLKKSSFLGFYGNRGTVQQRCDAGKQRFLANAIISKYFHPSWIPFRIALNFRKFWILRSFSFIFHLGMINNSVFFLYSRMVCYHESNLEAHSRYRSGEPRNLKANPNYFKSHYSNCKVHGTVPTSWFRWILY